MAADIFTQAAWWPVHNWVEITLCPWMRHPISLCREGCVVHVSRSRAGSLRLRRSLRLLITWGLKLSWRSGVRAFSDHSWACEQPGTCMLEFFKAPYTHVILQFFVSSFLVSLLLPPAVISPSGSWDVKQLLLIDFWKIPRDKAVCTEPTLSQIK